MKKSRVFIFILALIYTLLIAVACDSAPTPDNLVPASVSLDGEGRGLVITGGDDTVTKYNIALIPEWDNGTYGEEICGMIGSRKEGVVTYGASYDSNVSNINLGYISMGKWTVYVQALNTNGHIIYEGNTTTYFSHSSTNVVVLLLPLKYGKQETLNYLIQLPQLYKTFEEHKEHYKVVISVKDISSSSIIYNEMVINPFAPELSSVGVPEISYSSWWKDEDKEKEGYNPPLKLDQGTYLVTVTLKELDAKTNKFKAIGGISRTITIVPGEEASIAGYVTPSDFISPDLEIPAPTINASMTGPVGSQKNNTPLNFECTDVNGNPGEYKRTFHWFIEGKEITDSNKVSTDNDTGKSTLTYSFTEYGRWDVTCKIVYSPSSPNAVSFCGEASYTVQIVP